MIAIVVFVLFQVTNPPPPIQRLPPTQFEFTRVAIKTLPTPEKSKPLRSITPETEELVVDLIFNPNGKIEKFEWIQGLATLRPTVQAWLTLVEFSPAILNGHPQFSRGRFRLQYSKLGSTLQYHFGLANKEAIQWLPLPIE